jgi:peptidyl-prolyl cis-trans isomerase D
MLTALRKQAGSWVVKALLLVLVLSFAIWGIGDIFYGNPAEESVASVGSSEITSGELNNAFNRSLDNLQRQFGGQLTREQALGIGLLQQTLQEQIGQRLVDLEASEMGISVDDDTLRRLITENPNFQSAGRFDRLRFNQLLRTTGLSEEGYLEAFRQELSRNALTSSIAAGASVPNAQAEAIYRYRNEERRGRFIKIEDASITEVAPADDATLEAIHGENEQQFTAPEYRAITYVTLEPEDLLEEVEIAEDDLRASYEDRSARYVTPEKRAVQQLLASDEDVATQASALIEEGKDFATVADELDGISFTDLGEVTENGMPAGIGGEAFAINEGEVTNAVQSPFGFHLFKVTAIVPEEVTPFEEARDEIRNELALIEAEDRLPAFATQLDDELAAGSSVREAADAIGIRAETIEQVDRQGRDQEGQPIEALAGWPLLLQTAFDAPLNEPSLLEETDDGSYYVIQVDEITEPRLKPLDEVREDVVALYEEQQRREGAIARAEELLAKLQETASLDTLAESEGLSIETIEPIKRSDSGSESGINRVAIQALFDTEEGQVADEVVPVEDGALVIANDEIINVDIGEDADGLEQLRAELERQVRADLLDQYGRALQDTHTIEINEDALTRLIEFDPATQGYGGGGMAPVGPQPGMF